MYKNVCSIKLAYLLVGIIFISGTIGCSTAYNNRYLFQPTEHDRAEIRAIAAKKLENTQNIEKIKRGEKVSFNYNGMKILVEEGVIYIKDLKISIPVNEVIVKITDADAIGFADDLSLFLRKRMNLARRARLTSSSLQVLTAAAAGSLGIIAHSDVETIAALGAVSAIIPEIQSIIGAKGRSEAYRDGLDLIGQAITRYHQARTANNRTGVLTDTLTEEGSNLMSEVAASIKAVDLALQSSIPSVEIMKAATGQLENKFNKFKIVPHNLHIAAKDGEGVVVATKDRIIHAVPKDARIVSIDNAQFGNNGIEKVTIKGIKDGDTVVEFFFDIGYKAEVNVKVGDGTPAPAPAPAPTPTPTPTGGG